MITLTDGEDTIMTAGETPDGEILFAIFGDSDGNEARIYLSKDSAACLLKWLEVVV